MMEERGVIDIQLDLADNRECVLAILEIENPRVLRDQAANRIERQPAHRCFDAPLVKFFDDAVTPLPAKTALGQIPSAPGKGADGREEKNAGLGRRAMRLRSAPVKLARQGWRSGSKSEAWRPTSGSS
jgi:hypothetical protein